MTCIWARSDGAEEKFHEDVGCPCPDICQGYFGALTHGSNRIGYSEIRLGSFCPYDHWLCDETETTHSTVTPPCRLHLKSEQVHKAFAAKHDSSAAAICRIKPNDVEIGRNSLPGRRGMGLVFQPLGSCFTDIAKLMVL